MLRELHEPVVDQVRAVLCAGNLSLSPGIQLPSCLGELAAPEASQEGGLLAARAGSALVYSFSVLWGSGDFHGGAGSLLVRLSVESCFS